MRIEWEGLDPAASGPRMRAWIEKDGAGWELEAHHSGQWAVHGPDHRCWVHGDSADSKRVAGVAMTPWARAQETAEDALKLCIKLHALGAWRGEP